MKYGLYDEAENIWIGNEPHWSEAMKDQSNDKRANGRLYPVRHCWSCIRILTWVGTGFAAPRG